MIRRTTLAGATAAAALALVVPAGAAFAASHTVHDARHDVQRNAGRQGSRPDPTRVEGDITRLRVSHRARLVRLTMRFAELDPPGAHERGDFDFVLGTSTHRFGISVSTDDEDLQGGPSLSRDDIGVQCTGLRSRVDYKHDRVTATVPRRCLGNPRWVRAGGSVITGDIAAPVPGLVAYADDVSLDGNRATGPRVFRRHH